MCITITHSEVLQKDTYAFKVVRMCRKTNRFFSLYMPKQRATQLVGNNETLPSNGADVEYKVGQSMKDDDGIGFYMYKHHPNDNPISLLLRELNLLRKWRNYEIVVLTVKIPAHTTVQIGQDMFNAVSFIAKDITVMSSIGLADYEGECYLGY